MFDKIALFWAFKWQVNRTKKLVLARNKDIDFATLGRTLSQNPLLPRKIPQITQAKIIKDSRFLEENLWDSCDFGDSRDFSESVRESCESNANLLCDSCDSRANPAHDSRESQESARDSNANLALIADTSLRQNIALVAHLRHYTPFFIIHKDIFISKYQILESLCFGADCVALSPKILDTQSLVNLANYARYLGLEVAILVSDKRDILGEISRIFIPKKSSLKNLLPKGAIIIDLK